MGVLLKFCKIYQDFCLFNGKSNLLSSLFVLSWHDISLIVIVLVYLMKENIRKPICRPQKLAENRRHMLWRIQHVLSACASSLWIDRNKNGPPFFVDYEMTYAEMETLLSWFVMNSAYDHKGLGSASMTTKIIAKLHILSVYIWTEGYFTMVAWTSVSVQLSCNIILQILSFHINLDDILLVLFCSSYLSDTWIEREMSARVKERERERGIWDSFLPCFLGLNETFKVRISIDLLRTVSFEVVTMVLPSFVLFYCLTCHFYHLHRFSLNSFRWW